MPTLLIVVLVVWLASVIFVAGLLLGAETTEEQEER